MEKEERHNTLDQDQEDKVLSNKKNRSLTTYTIAVIVVALIFAGRVLVSSQNATNWLVGGLFSQFQHLTQMGDKPLAGEENDRVNVLLLGIGGDGHDGPYLTDTIMLASLKPSTKQIALISIPRDLVTPVSNWEKINSIDAYAEMKNPGSGGATTAQAIGQLLQMPIQYYVRVDFQGFVNIINDLGGIQVNVENTLDDYSYPITGQEDNPNYAARFEHLHIDKGLQTMNGDLALAYARSRHAAGAEGSDFARARRQQLVLEAVKAKLLSAQTLLNPVTLAKIITELNKNISTNLSVGEILRVWDLFKGADHSHITNKVLSDAPDNFLVAGRGQDGAYILMPRSGNFTDIRNFVQNIFTDSTSTPPAQPAIPTINDGSSVVVLNGTWISGLAGKTAVPLEQAKFNVLKIANAPERNYTKTVVYDLSGGKRASALTILERLTGATPGGSLPAWLDQYKPAPSDSTISSSSSESATTTASSGSLLNTISAWLTGDHSASTSSATPNRLATSTETAGSPTPLSPNFIVILGTDAN